MFFAAAGVADPLSEAYRFTVEVFDVALGNLEVSFPLVEGAGGGQALFWFAGGGFPFLRGRFGVLDQSDAGQEALLGGVEALWVEALVVEPLPQAVSVIGDVVPGHVGQVMAGVVVSAGGVVGAVPGQGPGRVQYGSSRGEPGFWRG